MKGRRTCANDSRGSPADHGPQTVTLYCNSVQRHIRRDVCEYLGRQLIRVGPVWNLAGAEDSPGRGRDRVAADGEDGGE
jgi:hypothetical protein